MNAGAEPPPSLPEESWELNRRLRDALARADARIAEQERELERWRHSADEERRARERHLKQRLETAVAERRALQHEVAQLREQLGVKLEAE
jgi:hypothetical protein